MPTLVACCADPLYYAPMFGPGVEAWYPADLGVGQELMPCHPWCTGVEHERWCVGTYHAWLFEWQPDWCVQHDKDPGDCTASCTDEPKVRLTVARRRTSR